MRPRSELEWESHRWVPTSPFVAAPNLAHEWGRHQTRKLKDGAYAAAGSYHTGGASIFRVSPLAKLIRQNSSLVGSFRVKTISRPSGEKTGCKSWPFSP